MHIVYFEVSKGKSHISLIFLSLIPNILIIPTQKQLMFTKLPWIMNERGQMTQETIWVHRKQTMKDPEKGKPVLNLQSKTMHQRSVAKSRWTLCDPMDCSPPGSSVHGIFQARILEWVVLPSSRGPSRPRDQTCVSQVSCIAGGFFTAEPLGRPQVVNYSGKIIEDRILENIC